MTPTLAFCKNAAGEFIPTNHMSRNVTIMSIYREEVLLQLKPLLIAYLEKGGYELVDLRFYRRQNELTFELLVDRAEGGINLDEVGRINRESGEIIEQSGLILEAYTLDVSSPGLDRPLATRRDFRRAQNSEVRIFLREAVEGKIEYIGVVEFVKDDCIGLNIKEKTIEIPLDKVNKAKRVII